MAQIAGKYVREKEENTKEYLTALGVPAENIKAISENSKELEITVSGSNYTFSSGLGTRTYELNKEITENLGGVDSKSVATLSGNTVTVVSNGADGKVLERVYEPTDSGLVLNMSTRGISPASKVYFKKV